MYDTPAKIAAAWDLLLGEIEAKGFSTYPFSLKFTRQELKPIELTGFFNRPDERYEDRVEMTGAFEFTHNLYFESIEAAFAFLREELDKQPSPEARRKRKLLKTLSDAKAEAEDLGIAEELNLGFAITALSTNLLEYHGG